LKNNLILDSIAHQQVAISFAIFILLVVIDSQADIIAQYYYSFAFFYLLILSNCE